MEYPSLPMKMQLHEMKVPQMQRPVVTTDLRPR